MDGAVGGVRKVMIVGVFLYACRVVAYDVSSSVLSDRPVHPWLLFAAGEAGLQREPAPPPSKLP